MDRETLVESAVGVVGVLVFVAAALILGLLYGGSEITSTGAYGLVVAIVGFVVVMSALGYWLSRQ